MKFLIVKPPLIIFITFGPKYAQISLACVPPVVQKVMFHNHIIQLSMLLFYIF